MKTCRRELCIFYVLHFTLMHQHWIAAVVVLDGCDDQDLGNLLSFGWFGSRSKYLLTLNERWGQCEVGWGAVGRSTSRAARPSEKVCLSFFRLSEKALYLRFCFAWPSWKCWSSHLWQWKELWGLMIMNGHDVAWCVRVPLRFPCYVLLALSWNTWTNENPSTERLSWAIYYLNIWCWW